MTAASVIKRRKPDWHVVVAEAGSVASFSACGMPYWVANVVEGGPEALVVVSAEDARNVRGIDLRVHTRATSVDAAARRVTLHSQGRDESINYDHLVLATGAQARVPFDTRGLNGVYALRHLDDAVRLKQDMNRSPPTKAVVVGGGFVGLEMAEAFVELGVPCSLIHSRPTLLSSILDEDLGRLVNERVAAAGVELVVGARADGVEGTDHVSGVRVGKRVIEADVAVLGLGVQPDASLGKEAGCELDPGGRVLVDDGFRTSVARVWACGDAVAVKHRVTGKPAFVPLALHANRAGRIVGENIVGGSESFPGALGTTITRFGELEVAATGLTQAAAQRAGMDAVAATIKSGSKAIYFPGTQKLRARIVAERGSGRLLGAQIVGGKDTAKRIDAMAAALWMGATLKDVEAMDFAYAPPFNPVWDPWAIAARMTARAARS